MPEDNCPFHGEHHKYFVFKTFEVFEPITVYVAEDENPNMMSYRNLYEKVEYAIKNCNCGLVVKQKVRQA